MKERGSNMGCAYRGSLSSILFLLVGLLPALDHQGHAEPLPPVELPTPNGLGACLWATEKPEPALRMYVRGAQVPGPHQKLFAYQPFMTGEIRLAGIKRPQLSTVEAGPVHRTCTLSGPEGAVRVTASRLTPALLFEVDAPAIELFAGDKLGGDYSGWCRGSLGGEQ